MSGEAVAATEFDRATVVEPLGDGGYRAHSSADWWAIRGPNGGFLAAIVIRAMEAELADPGRPARSITLHYLRPPRAGELRVDVAVERTGRTLSTLTARVTQDEQLCVLATAAFAGTFSPIVAYADQMPDAPDPEVVPLVPDAADRPPIAHRVDVRPCIGPAPFTGAGEALTGGWIRLREPHPVDAAAIALYMDAWFPAVFPRLTGPIAAPTIDLTIFFREPATGARVPEDAPLLVRFRSAYAADGMFEEDGELWSPDGRLLAQSRQLALLLPFAPQA